MVKLFQITGLLCILYLLPVPVGADISNPAMSSYAQDATGTVWALPTNDPAFQENLDGKVCYWEKDHWVVQPVPGTAGFRRTALTCGDDGIVYVLWEQGDQKLVTVQRKIAPKIRSHFIAQLAPLTTDFFNRVQRSLWAGTAGDLWIADSNNTLLHIVGDGEVSAFSADPKQYFFSGIPSTSPQKPLSSLVDGQGRRWFWRGAYYFWEMHRPRGVMIWNGKTLAYHATFTGLPDAPLSALMRHDSDHLWVAIVGNPYLVPPVLGGLFEIETKTLTATPIAPPPGDPFQNITRVFRANRDWYAVSYPTDYSFQPRLWRRRGEAWQSAGKDVAVSIYSDGNFAPEANLETTAGTWMAIYDNGLLWFPNSDEPPVKVDWRRGFPSNRVTDLFQMPDGQMMVVSSGQSVITAAIPHPPYPPRTGVKVGTAVVPAGITFLVSDPRCNLWGLKYLNTGGHALEGWDGRQWHQYLIPNHLIDKGEIIQLLAADTLGRLWLSTDTPTPSPESKFIEGRLLYDPAQRKWTSYKTVADAILTAASLPGMAFLSAGNIFQRPAFDSGRVTYADRGTVFLGSHHVWQHWKAQDVLPSYPYDYFDDAPRFDRNGRLEIDLSQHRWAWTPQDGWQVQGEAIPQILEKPLPPGGPPGFRNSLLLDSHGEQWAKHGNDLYLIRNGFWHKLTALSGLGSPFADGRGLTDVLQDPRGRYFFQTTPGGFYEYVSWLPPVTAPPPAPDIRVTRLTGNSVKLHFTPRNGDPSQFQWRLGGGDWKGLPKSNAVILTALAPGSYRVQAQAINSLAQASPAPSSVVFVLRPAPKSQIAHWVRALLGGSDTEREAGVSGLTLQGLAVLPALKAAVPGASEAARWWLEATRQQIMRDRDGKSKPAIRR